MDFKLRLPVALGLLAFACGPASVLAYRPAPPPDERPPVVVGTLPAPESIGVSETTVLLFELRDPAEGHGPPSGVDPGSVLMTVSGQPVVPSCYPDAGGGCLVLYQSPEPYPEETWISVALRASDRAGNVMPVYILRFQTRDKPEIDEDPPYLTGHDPLPESSVAVEEYPEFVVDVVDDQSGVTWSTVEVLINGKPAGYSPSPIAGGLRLRIPDPLGPGDPAADLTIKVGAADQAGNLMSESYRLHLYSTTDVDGPRIDDCQPVPDSTGVSSNAVISCRVSDSGAGVDPASIVMVVNGDGAAGLAIQADGDGYRVIRGGGHLVPGRFTVTVSAADLAGNRAALTWEFTVWYNQPPALVYPEDGAWLNYYLEESVLRFSWTGSGADWFRIGFQVLGSPFVSTVETDPQSLGEIGGVVTWVTPVDRPSWSILNELGGLWWQVVAISGPGGEPISAPSECFRVTFAPPDSVVLRLPEDYAALSADEPPVFRWDPDPRAVSYLIGFARLGTPGMFLADVFSVEVPHFVTDLPLTIPSWDYFADGYWMWTVLANYEDGSHSNFMLFHFTKSVFTPS